MENFIFTRKTGVNTLQMIASVMKKSGFTASFFIVKKSESLKIKYLKHL